MIGMNYTYSKPRAAGNMVFLIDDGIQIYLKMPRFPHLYCRKPKEV